ncbi:MAG: efflux RND transporter periplasmic adaptor subunit [Bacteroidota bacterium]|nr:efflux RND transporter periplasmic adaptor subunit [Bacteroidota bacterium]
MRINPVLCVLAASLTLGACSKKEEKVQQADPVKVTVQEITATSQKQELVYSGSIEPDNTAQIGFAVPGTVSKIMVQEGQHVSKGQLLATIDATEYANALTIANAGLEQAEDMYRRLEELYKKGSLPEKDYIDIKTKLAQAKANKNISAKRIKDSRLIAPMSGIITGKMIECGSTAAPGVPAFTIVKTDQVYARVSVSESEVGSIRTGMNVQVFVPTLNESFTGKVSITNPQADAVSKTYTVKIQIRNQDGKLLPGMIAEAKINTDKMIDAIAIPAKAIVRDADDITYVFVANDNRKANRKRITTGNVMGTNDVLVKDGLAVGDKVVVAGQTRLKDGASVSF